MPDKTDGTKSRGLAILTVHGMGTHLPLSGIQDMVKVLRKIAVNPNAAPEISSSVVDIAGSPTVRSQAIVDVQTSSGPKTVTVFEANYSSVPKGAAGITDVIRFLFFAGWNGLGADDWQRWLFGRAESCRPKNFTHFALLTVIAALLSLIGLNALFTAELFTQEPLAAASFASKPTSFQAALCLAMVVILVFGGLFAVATMASRHFSNKAAGTGKAGPVHQIVSNIGYWLFILLPVVVVLMTAYVGMRKIWPRLPFDDFLGSIAPLFVVVRLAGALVVWFVLTTLLSNRPLMKKIWRWVIALGMAALIVFQPAVQDVVFKPGITSVDFLILGGGFMCASGVFRGFLVDYVGDVTAYINGSQASKFAEVRERVQVRVRNTLEQLLKEKYEVVVVAHSLGSVVAYDVINRVLLEQPEAKIKAYVTYGCPLDKIAYLFRTEAHHGNVVRDELVGSRQPFLTDAFRLKIPWWNVQARYDVIGSRTTYYNKDTSGAQPDPTDVRQVDDATNLTPIASHGAYSDHKALSGACQEALA